jgi:hypothetical protein
MEHLGFRLHRTLRSNRTAANVDNNSMAKESFPEIFETQRLVLRRYRSDDSAGILRLAHQNRAQLIRDFEQQASLQSLADAQTFTVDKQEEWSRKNILLRHLAETAK